jgi:putative ATP-dependent endonuclease of OLD family
MRISRLTIENFRSIRKLEVELGESTVFIGRNNAGKTAVLDALRIALTRKWGQRGTGFTEYDIHLRDENADPQRSPGVQIEVRVEEQSAGDWSDAIQQDLDNISQLDPVSGLTSVTLRVTCAWNVAEEAYVPTWQFLNAARQPLAGVSARKMNLERFWQYMPVFYLDALRDADDEFSPRSQFWGRLLKAIQIPKDLEARVHRVLGLVNGKLLRADPKLSRISDTLTGATRIAAKDRDGSVDLRLLPLKTWDLLSKAEIILRNASTYPWLPLKHHGQGVQSLSVLFLFQAFVDHLLKEIYEPDATAVLALEEPETHLHPQAARTLWNHVSNLSGQKLVTTHSPYFVQHVPFRDLRLLRLGPTGTEVRWLPARFTVEVPAAPTLAAVVGKMQGKVAYEAAANRLTVHGALEEAHFRGLLTCYGGLPELKQAQDALRDLKERSAAYVSDEDLKALDTYARRIRGEIFFADRWLLVEGQAEFTVVTALAEVLGFSLDDYGIALIDAVNNGNPPIFAALARAFRIPWMAVLDGDQAGQGYKTGILKRGFHQSAADAQCLLLPAGCLEQQLLADGIETEIRVILMRLGKLDADKCNEPALLKLMDSCKTDYAAELASELRRSPALAQRILEPVRIALATLRTLP